MSIGAIFALDIAGYEMNVNYDVLICACLLHDIGRREQFETPKVATRRCSVKAS
jgi:HD superfamily phosphodiesterase